MFAYCVRELALSPAVTHIQYANDRKALPASRSKGVNADQQTVLDLPAPHTGSSWPFSAGRPFGVHWLNRMQEYGQ